MSDHRTIVTYDPKAQGYNFGPRHPLTPLRMQAAVELMLAAGVLRPDEVLAVAAASTVELEAVHSPELVVAVQAVDQPGWVPGAAAERHGLVGS